MMKDSQKEAEHDHKPGSGILGRQVYKNGKKALTNLDRSTTRYISRGQPLTKSMYTRLERLEAAGYIKIEDLQSRRDIANALGNHNDKLNLTRYDLNLVNKISENCVEPQDNPRVTRLLDEGYLTRDKNNKLLTSEKFIITAQRLIQKELLDTRNYTTITCSTKKRALQVTDDREHTTYLSPDREIKRSLNEDQIRLIKTLKTFSNMSEHQIYDLYQQAGQDIYFAKDLNELLKKGVLQKEESLILQQCFMLYNLKYAGNKIGDHLSGHKGESRTYSKAFTKSDKELLHDLLQYEAAKVVKSEIEANGGQIDQILIDRNKRSQIYNNLCIRETGGLEIKIMDIEIHYQDKDGKKAIEYIEVDRGYEPKTIIQKSANFKSIRWFTDLPSQASRISKYAKSADKVYLLS